MRWPTLEALTLLHSTFVRHDTTLSAMIAKRRQRGQGAEDTNWSDVITYLTRSFIRNILWYVWHSTICYVILLICSCINLWLLYLVTILVIFRYLILCCLFRYLCTHFNITSHTRCILSRYLLCCICVIYLAIAYSFVLYLLSIDDIIYFSYVGIVVYI